VKSGHPYWAMSTAVGVADAAVYVGYGYSHPIAMTFFTAWLLLPLVVFLYLGVLERFESRRLRGGGGPERGDELVPVADTPVGLASHTHSSRSHPLEELPSQPQREAA
jgi:hypothetical protein